MPIDKEYPGDSRMDPVDVDVLDNLINAKAAYLEAIADAGEHFGMDPSAMMPELEDLMKSMAQVSGIFLNAMAAVRV